MIAGETEAMAWLAARPEWSVEVAARLTTLVSMLEHENARQNLVAEATLSAVWQRHVADSAQLLEYVPRGTSPHWLDLGTGAGFPGLVIAAMNPSWKVTLVESRRRRVEWLQQVCARLGLTGVEVLGNRLELVQPFPACIISARAFAPLPRLLDLSARFSTPDTIWLLPKGRSARQELSTLSRWNHQFHVEPSLTDPEAGIIVGSINGRQKR